MSGAMRWSLRSRCFLHQHGDKPAWSLRHRSSIGIELSERYNKMAQRRLEKVTAPMALAEVWR